MNGYRSHRPRRLRLSSAVRELVRETSLRPAQLIAPLFVTEAGGREPVPSMPGVERLPVADVVTSARALRALGVRSVILFGIPARKDATGSSSHDDAGALQRAVRAVRDAVPDLTVMTDVCLCEYTDHGHCGLVGADGIPDDDATLPVLARVAVSHADAGAQVVAPSGMMDGTVRALRAALDAAGHGSVAILSYSVKYASAFYGPFRDAAASALSGGDRRTHQMDPANAREALREADLDVAEGADMLMVKPASHYLDVVRDLRLRHPSVPLVAYQVSGEYAMLKAAAAAGWLDERAGVLESLLSIRRAGADAIITYHAADAARWLSDP
jgi:porphobilinogen synthase